MTRKCKLDGLLSSGFQPSMFRFERYSVVSFQDLQRMSWKRSNVKQVRD